MGTSNRPPLLGRSAESAELRRYAKRAAEGHAQVVFIAGPPGIGKTALIEDLLAACGDWAVLTTSGIADETNVPYAAVNRLIARIRGRSGRDIAGQFGAVPRGSSLLVAGGVLIAALDEAGVDSPLILIVDHAHALDGDSLRSLGFALLRMSADRMLTLVATGNAIRTRRAMGLHSAGREVHQIELSGLSASQVRRLITSHGYPPPSETRLARLLAWSDGNPLHLETMLSSLRSNRLPKRPEDLEIPESLTASIGEWLLSFPDDARKILEALAVLNTPVSLPLLDRLVASDDLVEGITLLVREGTVAWATEAGVPIVKLTHPSQRDALYEAVPQVERQRLHRLAADVLGPPANWRHRLAATEAYDARLAEVLREASAIEGARGETGLAAELSLGVSHVDPDGRRRQESLLRAVRLFVISGQYRPALKNLDRVAKASASPERSEALGLLCYADGQDAAACEYLRLALEQYADADSCSAAAQAAVELSTVQGSLGLAKQSSASAELALSNSTNPIVVGLARANRARSRALTEGFQAGLTELSHLNRNPAAIAEADLEGLTYRGMFRAMTGRITDALSDLAVVTHRKSPALNRASDSTAHVIVIWCRMVLGQLQEARRELSIAFDLAQTSGRSIDHAALHGLSAMLYAVTGQAESADADLSEARDLASGSDYAGPAFHLSTALAVISSVAGDHGSAVEYLSESSSDPANRPRGRFYAIWRLPTLGVSGAKAGRLDVADRALLALRKLDADGALIPVTVQWVQGNIFAARGDLARATHAFQAGLAIPPLGGEPKLYRSLLRLDHAAALIRSGDLREAENQLLTVNADMRAMGLDPYVAQGAHLLDRINLKTETREPDELWNRMTDREKDIARLVARGWTNKEMAEELYVSRKTIEYHLSNIFDKGHLENRRQLRDVVQSLIEDAR